MIGQKLYMYVCAYIHSHVHMLSQNIIRAEEK